MQEKPNNSRKKKSIDYMHYAGMAFQMGIMLAIGAFIGTRLDRHFETDRPYFTALCVILFLFAALYLVFKDLAKGKNEQ